MGTLGWPLPISLAHLYVMLGQFTHLNTLTIPQVLLIPYPLQASQRLLEVNPVSAFLT